MLEKIFLFYTLFVLNAFVMSGQNVFSASVEIQNLSSLNNTVISGKVKHPTSSPLRFKYFRNNIALEDAYLEVPILEDSSFRLSFTLESPNPLYLQLDGQAEIEIYVAPKDSLYLTFDAQNPIQTINFEGKGSAENEYLLKSKPYFEALKKDNLIKTYVGVEEEQSYRKQLDLIHQKMLAYFAQAQSSKWAASFQHYAKANIDYWWASQLLKTKKRHRGTRNARFSDVEQFDYYDFLTNVNVNNDFVLNNRYYLEFVEQFVKFCNEYPNPEKYLPIVHKKTIKKRTKTSIQKFVKVNMQSLDVLENPYADEKKVISKLDYGTELLYLRNKTNENIKYRKGSYIYSAFFFQVELKDGTSGWVSGAGISFLDKRIENPVIKEDIYAPLTESSSVEQFLQGKVLYFVKAKSLYWKTFLNPLADDFALELADFRDENPYPEFTKILSKAYEVAQLRGKGDMKLVNTYAFSNLRTPIVDGVDIPLPFERSAHVSLSENYQYHHQNEDVNFENIDIFNSELCGQLTKLDFDLNAELVLYTNDLLFSEKRYLIHGKKVLYLNLYQPILGEIILNKIHFPIKITPGDHLSIVASQLGSIKIPKYSNKGAHVNSFLRDDYLKFSSYFNDLKLHFEKDNPSKFKAYITLLHDEKNDFIEGYPMLTPIEQEYWKEDGQYWSAYQLLKYAEQYEAKNHSKLADSFFDFLNTMDISKDWILPNFNYSYFLDSYLDYFELNFDDVLVGEARNYQKAKALAYKCMIGDVAPLGKDIKNFIMDCENPSYCETLSALYNEKKGLIEGTRAIDFELEDINGNQVALSDFKGKVIFLDFWASWCVPCIRSMYKNQQLIANRKDVVFVSVSLDDDVDQWRSFVKSRNFKGIHLFLNRQKFGITNIQKIYQAFQLPTYILIDKNFNIAFPDAAKPGTTLWNNQVNSLQKESVK